MNIRSSKKDIEFIELKVKLIKLLKEGSLDDLIKEHDEISMFSRMYKLRGPFCPYLVGVCKAVKVMKPDLYKHLQTL